MQIEVDLKWSVEPLQLDILTEARHEKLAFWLPVRKPTLVCATITVWAVISAQVVATGLKVGHHVILIVQNRQVRAIVAVSCYHTSLTIFWMHFRLLVCAGVASSLHQARIVSGIRVSTVEQTPYHLHSPVPEVFQSLVQDMMPTGVETISWSLIWASFLFFLSAAWVSSGQIVYQSAKQKRHCGHSSLELQKAN